MAVQALPEGSSDPAVTDVSLSPSATASSWSCSALGMRQIHGAAHDRRAGADQRRHGVDRRAGRQPCAGQGPRHRHGVPVLRALSAYDGVRQSRLRAAPARHRPAPRSRGGSQNVAGEARADARFCSASPTRFPAGSGSGWRSGRAIVRDPKVFLFDEPLSNLDAALRVSTRNELIKQQHELGTTTDLCHPRPGRGHDHGRSHLHHEPGRGGADRPPARGLSQARRHLCRPVSRQPADEPLARHGSSVRTAAFALHAGGIAIPVTAIALCSAWRRMPAGEVILGIRPEDLYERPPPDDAGRSVRLPARVTRGRAAGRRDAAGDRMRLRSAELIARIGRETDCAEASGRSRS